MRVCVCVRIREHGCQCSCPMCTFDRYLRELFHLNRMSNNNNTLTQRTVSHVKCALQIFHLNMWKIYNTIIWNKMESTDCCGMRRIIFIEKWSKRKTWNCCQELQKSQVKNKSILEHEMRFGGIFIGETSRHFGDAQSRMERTFFIKCCLRHAKPKHVAPEVFRARNLFLYL